MREGLSAAGGISTTARLLALALALALAFALMLCAVCAPGRFPGAASEAYGSEAGEPEAGAELSAAGSASEGSAAADSSAGGSDSDDAESGSSKGRRTSSEIGQLVDTFLAGQKQLPGIAIAASVDGGDTVLRTYGYGDAAGTSPVDESTTFEWGRCSDLIVWVCVLQLVEDGLVDLDASVAGYLPDSVTLPDGYGSLSLMDLMNHTTGFDVSAIGTGSSLPDGTLSALAALSLYSVEGEFAPGEIVAYTPFDALLGAVVVEAVSGVSFVDYVEENVFEPLGMGDTYLMVGGSSKRLASAENAPAQALSLAAGTKGSDASLASGSSSSALCCIGTVSDMLTLANAAMGVEGAPTVFDDSSTSDLLFTVSRTYSSLGVARVAHGLFAFPLSSGVFGLSASTKSGYSASVYVDRANGLAIVVMAAQSGRSDLTQGLARVVFGRTDSFVTSGNSAANSVWVGTYQDASNPTHGPSKLVTALSRVSVGVNAQGVLTFDGVTATSLGVGVYSIDAATDQDVYRFHIDGKRGAEFSRAASDSYAVPRATLFLEAVLLGGFAVAAAFNLVFAVSAVAARTRALVRRRRLRGLQPASVSLAFVSSVAQGVGVYAVYSLAEGVSPAALGTLLVAEAVYIVVAALLVVWIAVTRWRNPGQWSASQLALCASTCVAAGVVMVNIFYWEMLPW